MNCQVWFRKPRGGASFLARSVTVLDETVAVRLEIGFPEPYPRVLHEPLPSDTYVRGQVLEYGSGGAGSVKKRKRKKKKPQRHPDPTTTVTNRPGQESP